MCVKGKRTWSSLEEDGGVPTPTCFPHTGQLVITSEYGDLFDSRQKWSKGRKVRVIQGSAQLLCRQARLRLPLRIIASDCIHFLTTLLRSGDGLKVHLS